MWRKNENNQRRGEWNALLLVMFALLTVAPSLLAAAPLHQALNASSQPQAVWQWLQSPAGAPARDLLAQALDLEHFPNLPPTRMAAALLKSGVLRGDYSVEAPQFAALFEVPAADTAHASPPAVAPVVSPAPGASHSVFRTLHEAAFVSGTRTNRWLE